MTKERYFNIRIMHIFSFLANNRVHCFFLAKAIKSLIIQKQLQVKYHIAYVNYGLLFYTG